METLKECKGIIHGGPMTTMILELTQAFLRTISHVNILDRYGLAELAYVGSIQLEEELAIVKPLW